MILYLDTSALVKLYAREHGSEEVCSEVAAAQAVATHAIAYVEARAAFARKATEWGDAGQLGAWKAALDADWKRLRVVEVSHGLLRRAAALAEAQGLRAFDSVHLAAAEQVFNVVGHGSVVFHFLVFDQRLREAASRISVPVGPA